jgi:peptidyl-prolyl cis-trans isomerase SurA
MTLMTLASSNIAQAQAQKNSDPVLVNRIVVVVNDDVITSQEVDERLHNIERRLQAQGTALPKEDDLRKQLLERMIVDRAQLQLAKENGFKVDDVLLDRSMLRLAEQNKLSLQEFRNQVERDGTSYASFREEVREDILIQRIREREVDSKIQVSELEVDNYLLAEEQAPKIKQEIHLAQILVRTPENASPEIIAKQLAKAEEIQKKLQAGEDFAKLSATFSDAPEALKGGDIGWREQDKLPKIFVDAISKIKVGEISEIVRSANGFHIVKLNGRRDLPKTAAAPAAPQQTNVSHILIKVNQIVTAAEAKAKLDDIRKKILDKTATFEEMAKQFSNDLSAAKGGELGWIFPGDTVPEFEQAMNKLEIGQVSEPVQSPFGFHLIKVTERKSDELSPERKRVAARQALRERKSEEELQTWIRELRDRAYVEFRDQQK